MKGRENEERDTSINMGHYGWGTYCMDTFTGGNRIFDDIIGGILNVVQHVTLRVSRNRLLRTLSWYRGREKRRKK